MEKHNKLVKLGILVVIVSIMCFSDWSLAADSGEGLKTLAEWIHLIISLLSWIWICFAQCAGQFLTNQWIYGEIIGLDVVLWNLWNLMKNIANFGLGFYFVYVIFNGLIKQGKEDIVKNLKSILLWILVAGVGIQVSRFGVAVVLDVSTITLAAAGAFPSQIISKNDAAASAVSIKLGEFVGTDGYMDQAVKEANKISLFPSNRGFSDFLHVRRVPIDQSKSYTKKDLMDLIMPNSENVSGPLYFLGFSILRTTELVSFNMSDENSVKATIFNALLQSGTTIIYSIEMLVLCIVAIMRVVYMWIFIVLSPIVVLLWCIKQMNSKGGKSDFEFLDSFTKQFNFDSFLWNAFKPTIIVLGFSLAMIFSSLMMNVITKSAQNDIPMGGMSVQSIKTDNKSGDKYTTSLDGDILSITLRNAGKTILELMVDIITVILVYLIINVAVKMGGGKDFVSKGIEKFQNNVGDMIGMMPLMPVSGVDKDGKPTTNYISAGKMFGLGKYIGSGNYNQTNILENRITHYTNKIGDKNEDYNKVVKSWFGDQTGYAESSEIEKIKNAMVSKSGKDALDAGKNEIFGIRTAEGKGMTLNPDTAANNGFWIKQFEEWLGKSEKMTGTGSFDVVWNNMISRWNDDKNKDNKSLEEMFKKNKSWEPNSVKAYANFFGLKLDSYDWEHLKNADISKK